MDDAMTHERIRIVVEYDISYRTPAGRIAAIEAAHEGAIDLAGSGAGGFYTAKRLLTETVEGDDIG
jgi:hypothetical protein